MARRTISFAEGIEYGVREKQIEMMRSLKRDVPFTEAVNWVLFQGLYWMARSSGMSDKDLGNQLVQWVKGLEKIDIDAFLDNIPVTGETAPTSAQLEAFRATLGNSSQRGRQKAE